MFGRYSYIRYLFNRYCYPIPAIIIAIAYCQEKEQGAWTFLAIGLLGLSSWFGLLIVISVDPWFLPTALIVLGLVYLVGLNWHLRVMRSEKRRLINNSGQAITVIRL